MDHDREFVGIIEGLSPNEIIREYRLVFTRRVIVLVEWQGGGGYWSRQHWDCPVPCGATVRFVELPRGGGGSNPLQVIATVALIAAASFVPGLLGVAGTMMGSMVSAGIMIGGSLLLGMFFGGQSADNSADSATAKSIYSVSSGGNNLRIGQPFAECFGLFKRFPDLIQYNYTRIEDNEQYLYFYMIITVGQCDVHGVYIDKTLMSDYTEASYRIIPPGVTKLLDGRYLESIPQIVTNIVWTCTEVNGQELDTDGVTVVVSARGTEASFIEYDVLFQNLVAYNDDGSKRSVSVTVVAEVRLVDDDGQPAGAWIELHRRKYSAASIDPLRYSNKCPAPAGPGRYQAKIYRTKAASKDSKVSDAVSLIGLRAYGGLHPYYGDVTCIEGRVRASDKLNGDVANKINVVATRKLPAVTESGRTLGLAATTSIVDAVVHIVTTANGGRQADDFIIWDVLSGIKQQVDGLGHGFNYVFASQGSVMDACTKAATCSRMVAYMPGGQFCMVRDDYQELPAITYTEDDYDDGSLKVNYSLATPDSPTCVKVNFLNPITWADDSVTYFDARGSEDIPMEITLDGCLSRQQAYEHAAYLYLDMFNNGATVEFTTGLKGHIPALFRKIAIDASHVDWGQSGKIAAVEDGLIWLSEPVDFKEEAEGQLFITEQDGGTGGPYTVTPTGNPHCVAGAIYGLKTLQDDDLRATKYLFGPASKEPLCIRLMGIQPLARNKVKLFGTIIDDATYNLPGTAPVNPGVIPAGNPLVSVSLVYAGDTVYTATWAGAASTFRVQVNLGSGYTTLEDNYAGFNYSFTTAASGTVSVKITPYYDGSLATTYAMESAITTGAAPSGLVVTLDADSIDATWNAVTGADGYDVTMTVDGDEVGSRYSTAASMSITTEELAAMGGPWSEVTVSVSAVVGGVAGSAASSTVTAPALSAPTTPVLQSLLSSAVIVSWGAVAGATGYQVHLGESAGFAPSSSTLKYSGGSTSATIPASLVAPYTHYIKVAAVDAYHQAIEDLPYSGELIITG